MGINESFVGKKGWGFYISKHFDSFMQETEEAPCAWHLSFTAVLLMSEFAENSVIVWVAGN